jgi:hypothetical protein
VLWFLFVIRHYAQINILCCPCHCDSQFYRITTLEHDRILFAMKNSAQKPVKGELAAQAHDIRAFFQGDIFYPAFKSGPEGPGSLNVLTFITSPI